MPDAPAPSESARAQMLADVERLILKLVRGSGLPAREHEDAAQEARMEVWRATERFDPTRGVKWVSYAGSTVKRLLQTQYARQLAKEKGEVQLDDLTAARVADPRTLEPDEEDETAGELFDAVQRQLTTGLLDALTPQAAKSGAVLPVRTIAERIAFEGLTVEDLAIQTGQQVKAVRANLKNGLRKLRQRGLTQHVATDAEVEAILAPDATKKHAAKPKPRQVAGFTADPWKSAPVSADTSPKHEECPLISAEAAPCHTPP